MLHILPSSAKQTIVEETVDYYRVFYNAFALCAQSAETLGNTLRHTDLFKSVIDMLSSFYRRAGSRVIFFLWIIYIFWGYGRIGIVQISGVLLLLSHAHVTQDHYDSE